MEEKNDFNLKETQTKVFASRKATASDDHIEKMDGMIFVFNVTNV